MPLAVAAGGWDAATSPHSRNADIVGMSSILAGGGTDGESFESCMFGQLDLTSAVPLQRWDPEVPQASSDAREVTRTLPATLVRLEVLTMTKHIFSLLTELLL